MITMRPMTWRELAAGAGALAAGIAVLAFAGGGVLWTHPLWTDELCCTLFPVERAASPFAVIENVAMPQDFAPPLLHLIVWTVGRLAGGMSPVLLRSIALASVALASLFVYAALRRRFGTAASAAGALAVIAHPLVVTHAFEGRFYGPWLCFAAAYAWAVGRRDRLGAMLQAVFAVCVVTIHWFGIISLTIMATGVALSFAPRWREGLRAIAPSGTGVAALLACLPLLIKESAGLTSVLWIEPLSGRQLLAMARVFFLTAVPATAALVLVASVVSARLGRRFLQELHLGDTLRQPSAVALASLCVFPLALLVVSIAVSPSILDRYAITTVLCWAPLVGLAVESLPKIGRVAALGALLFQLKPSVALNIRTRQAFADQVAADSRAFDRAKLIGVPVVFPWLHSVYPVVGPTHRAPTLARMLDVPDTMLAQLYPGERLAWFRGRARVEIHSARAHAAVHGFPIVVTTAELDTVARFAVMTSDLRVRGGVEQARIWGRIVFPRHAVLRLDDQVSLFVRK